MRRARIEATGRGWKVALAAFFVVAVLGIFLLVQTGIPAIGWLVAGAAGGMIVSAFGAWLTSG